MGTADYILKVIFLLFLLIPCFLFIFYLCANIEGPIKLFCRFSVICALTFSSLYVEFVEMAFLVPKGIIINRMPGNFGCFKAQYV